MHHFRRYLTFSYRHFENEQSPPYSDLTKQLCDIYVYTECYMSKAEADKILYDIINTTNPCIEKLSDEQNQTWQSFDDIPPYELFINAALEYMLINLDDETRLAISNRADQVRQRCQPSFCQSMLHVVLHCR